MTSLAALLLVGAISAWPPNLVIVDARLLPGEAGTGLWRPSADQAIAARAALRRYVITPPVGLDRWNTDGARMIAEHFDRYLIQVEGVRAPGPRERYAVEGRGPRQIHVDGFCAGAVRDLGARAMQEQLVVLDGGPCIFQARYDVASGLIVSFSVNGVA